MKLLAAKGTAVGVLLGLNLWLKHWNCVSNLLWVKMNSHEYVSKVGFLLLFLLTYVVSRNVLMKNKIKSRQLWCGNWIRLLEFSALGLLCVIYSEMPAQLYVFALVCCSLKMKIMMRLNLWLWDSRELWKRQSSAFEWIAYDNILISTLWVTNLFHKGKMTLILWLYRKFRSLFWKELGNVFQLLPYIIFISNPSSFPFNYFNCPRKCDIPGGESFKIQEI